MSVVTRIRRSEELLVPFTPEEVWDVLTDVEAYPDWWPSTRGLRILNAPSGLLGTEWELRPLAGRMVRFRLEEVEAPFDIRIRFVGGALEGPGGFHLAAEGSATCVCYEIDVFARGFGVALFGHILPIDRLYGLQMRRVLKSLGRRLEGKRKPVEPLSVPASVEAAQTAASPGGEEAIRVAEEAASQRGAEEAATRARAEAVRLTVTRADEEAAAKRAGEEAAARPVAGAAVGSGAFARTIRALGVKAARWLRESPRLRSTDEPVLTKTPVTEPSSNLEVARSYLRALSSHTAPVGIAQFFQPDALAEEFPNLILPSGATREFDAILEAWSKSREMWSAQTFDLLGATGGGSQVAMEVRWAGRCSAHTDLYKVGEPAAATLALFLKFQDRRIVRQRAYFCFESPCPRQDLKEGSLGDHPAGAPGATPPASIGPGPRASNFDVARSYFEALSAGASGEAIAHFFSVDAIQEDLPSRLSPSPVTRNLRAIQNLRDQSIASLLSQTYELMGATGGGSTVALEIQWMRVFGPGHPQYQAGERVESRLAVFLKFRDGLIVRQRTYECA